MSDPFATQRNKYKHTVSASALLFNYNDHRALRVEALSIGLEFTDNAYIGSDPEGILSYNYFKDFHKDDQNKPAGYSIDSVSYKNQPCVHVKFYHDGKKDRPFAEFLAEDPTNAAQRTSMINYESSGLWKNLNLGSATASVDKDGDNDTVTLTFPTIHKKATFSVSGSSVADVAFDVYGTVFFKDVNALDSGIVVNYSSDRLVFYHDKIYAKDFTAYFIPFEDGGDGTQSLQLDSEKEFLNVQWSSI